MLAPILDAASLRWILGVIENNIARPLTRKEIEDHIEEYETLKERSSAALVPWATQTTPDT